jgi:sugar transferase (PEP-CTERM/EpsH1 system associated)
MSRLSENGHLPLVAHVIQRLAMGGLENGLVNLINYMPEDRYRHIVVCLADTTDYSRRITQKNAPVIALHQRQGQDFAVHWRLLKLLLRLRPAIVHTRNLGSLEFQAIAAVAGVRGRVHGEHGRDMEDLDGTNPKYKFLRKTIRPFVQHYTAVSNDLARWLVDTIGIGPDRVTQIYNGVDTQKFRPRERERGQFGPEGFLAPNSIVVGTVGRMEPVKDQITLTQAFIQLVRAGSEARKRLRLVMIGDGSLRRRAIELLRSAQVESLAWLPGERDDVAELMRSMDLFVLPSLREGISNTILEAMATGLPIVAARVGGNPELVDAGSTGDLVPHSDPVSLACAIDRYFSQPKKAIQHGTLGRRTVERRFSMESMVEGYLKTYDAVMQRRSAQPISIPFRIVTARRLYKDTDRVR